MATKKQHDFAHEGIDGRVEDWIPAPSSRDYSHRNSFTRCPPHQQLNLTNPHWPPSSTALTFAANPSPLRFFLLNPTFLLLHYPFAIVAFIISGNSGLDNAINLSI
jgi:hypothetical protein